MKFASLKSLASAAALGISLSATTEAFAGHPSFSNFVRAGVSVAARGASSQQFQGVASQVARRLPQAAVQQFQQPQQVFIPIDPGIGNGQGVNNSKRAVLKQVLTTVVKTAIENELNGGLGGNGNGGQCNNNGGNNNGGQCNNNGGNNNGGNVNNVNNNAGQVQTPVADLDLELIDFNVVSPGDASQGAVYRLQVRNNLNSNVTSPFAVAVYASMSQEVGSNDPRGVGQLDSLAAGATGSIDVQMPAGSTSYRFLTPVVGAPNGLTDANDSNNSGLYDRSLVRDVAAKAAAVSVDERLGGMVIEGEGFGNDQGNVTLLVGSTKYTSTISNWSSNKIVFTVDGFNGTGDAKDAAFVVARADGRTAAPLEISLEQ